MGAASKHVILTLNLCYRETKYHSRGVRHTDGKTGRRQKGDVTSVESKKGRGQGRESRKRKKLIKVSVS